MPGVVINALRFLFIAIVQSGAWLVASNVLEGLVDYIRDALKKEGKLGDSVIDDVMLNTTLDVLVMIGITVVSLKTKIPLRLAEKLGLKAGATSKRTLSQPTKAAVAKTASSALLGAASIKRYLGVFAVSLVGSLPWLPGLIQQFGDQATFNPKNANNYYEGLFGVRPFQEPESADTPGSFTGPEFEEYYLGLQAAGASTINDPAKMQTVMFSKAALADLVRGVYGIENAAGHSTTATKLKQALAPYIRLSGGTSAPIPAATSTSSPSVSVPSVKVFTGIVSSGVLGKGLEFTARQDDLIESIAELNSALNNNLAPFLAALAGRLIYEVKVVSSIIGKDGVKKTGAAQVIESRSASTGKVTKKTIINKWAVVDIYVLTDRNVRSKISQVVLGPTNAAKFQPGATELSGLSAVVADNVVMKDTDEITGIVTDTPTENIPKEETEEYIPTTPSATTINTNNPKGRYIYKFGSNQIRIDAKNDDEALAIAKTLAPNYGYKWEPKKKSFVPLSEGSSSNGDGGGGNSSSGLPAAALSAQSLSDFYKAQGLALPPLSERAMIYQGFGLGSSSLYAGTAEQNTKLLKKLQGK